MLGHGAIGEFAIGEGPTGLGEQVLSDKWYPQLSEPVRTRLNAHARALIASGQFFTQAAPFAESVTEDRWHQPWSEPVRFKLALRPAIQQAAFFPVQATWDIPWYARLSEPVRVKPAVLAANQQALFFPTQAVWDIRWYARLSEPVRVKRAVRAANQPYLFYQPRPVLSITSWFGPLSEPVRIKRGLRAALQRFFETKTFSLNDVTVTLNAVETNNDTIEIIIQASDAVSITGIRTSIIESGGDRGGVASVEEE